LASLKRIFAEISSGVRCIFKETPSRYQAFQTQKVNITNLKTQFSIRHLSFIHNTNLSISEPVVLRNKSVQIKPVKDYVLTRHNILKTNQKARPHTNEDALKHYTGRLRLCHKTSFFPMLLFDLTSCFSVKHA